MSCKKSLSSVQKNAKVWSHNLLTTSKMKRRPNAPLVATLKNFARMPKHQDVIGRFLSLRGDVKEKNKWILIIIEELQYLWKKFSFPEVSKCLISRKVKNLVIGYEKNQRRKSVKYENELKKLYGITKVNGNSLCTANKQFYNNHKKSGGKVGYIIEKPAPISSVHPSKRHYLKNSTSTSKSEILQDSLNDTDSKSETSTESTNSYSIIEPSHSFAIPKKTYSSTSSASSSKMELSSSLCSDHIFSFA